MTSRNFVRAGICSLAILISGGVVTSKAYASGFDAICQHGSCRVELSPTGITVGSTTLRNDKVITWRASNAPEQSALSRSGHTAKGAALGALTGLAVGGPIGAVVGMVWGGSEESSGQVSPEMSFIISGYNEMDEVTALSFHFIDHASARRLRMELPMFTGLVAGEMRSIESLQSTLKLDTPQLADEDGSSANQASSLDNGEDD